MPNRNEYQPKKTVTKYQQNDILFTRDGRIVGNAIVRDFDELTSLYLLKSDYGNEFFLSEADIEKQFFGKGELDESALPPLPSPHKYSVTSNEWRRPLQDYKRRSGRTTRIVDELVQCFFNMGSAVCYDHHIPTGKDRNNMRRYVMHQVVRRLQYEHGIKSQDMVINEEHYIITNVNWKD